MHKTLAAQFMTEGRAFRTSVGGQPRAPLCGMGVCYECRATVEGVPHVRTCQVALGDPPPAPRSASADILIAGAGPAGIAAAAAAAESGRKVTLLDDNPAAGGQIWRGQSGGREWFRRLELASFDFLPQTRIVGGEGNQVTVETNEARATVSFNQLILATGARELFLPFPGWTLPNVTGAGGLQALVKGGLDVRRKRVVVAGSGPLLLAVAAYLRRAGARVLLIVEQAPFSSLLRFGARLTAPKLAQAAALQFQLLGIPYKTSAWVERAEGKDRLESVVVKGRRIPCDYLAIGYGLAPNTELAAVFRCELRNGVVHVDDYQRTSTSTVFCAGEPTGIGGVDLSLIEGEIAGYAAAGDYQKARTRFAERAAAARFALHLNRAFALRPELRNLPDDGTLVCRCEDVSYGVLKNETNWREAKLQHRCGMGPCQGRVCGPATEFLFGWHHDSVRPPVFPARVETLIGEPHS